MRNLACNMHIDLRASRFGEHIQAHLRTHPGQFSRQEVRRPHPLFERPERMLNRPISDSHHLRCFTQPKLHFLQNGFMFPASDSPLRTRCTLRFQCAQPLAK
jgi:hypothetical protein